MYLPPNSLRAPLSALLLGLPAIVAVQTASLWLLAREAPTASVSLERLADAFTRPAAAPERATLPAAAPVAPSPAVVERAPNEPPATPARVAMPVAAVHAAPVAAPAMPAVAAAGAEAPGPVAAAAAAVPPPVAAPVAPEPAPPAHAVAEPVKPAAGAAEPAPAAHAAPLADAAPVHDEAPAAAGPLAPTPPLAPTVAPPLAPVAAAPAAPVPVNAPLPPAAAAEAVAATPAPVAPAAAAPEPAAPIPGLLGPDWVKAQSPRQRTLLLRTEPTLDALRRWLAGRDLELPLAVVESREPGRRGYVLLGGSYADSNEAAAAAKALTKRSGVRAWVRRFDQVQPPAGG
ncbi:septal ring-binding cell division protein DamX [Plasticicumulans lactativorans]|uniref:Septal ring-binding cell division protein DamX n=1 Tax=Plasticicumulans lactativorans TaxID=1133106 RepID=A0A4R2KRD0_9GAMM|nr:hypothetical protein [Plasticicumulans lactativorans]TCO76841.1 septal ring-binding cell division protein DamX [Plasticicumulans lactativorans]